MKGRKKKVRLIKKLHNLIIFLVPVVIFLIIFNTHHGVWNIEADSKLINISQEILPDNSVDSWSALTEIEDNEFNFISSNYKIVLADNVKSDNNPSLVGSSLVTLKGNSVPYSYIFLSISSDTFNTTVQSNALGQWSWTNYGKPLDIGEHIIGSYTFAKYSAEDIQEVAVNYYKIIITNDEESNKPVEVLLNENNSIVNTDVDKYSQLFLSDNSLSPYIFLDQFNNANIDYVYNSNEVIDVQYNIAPLKETDVQEAILSQEIYYLDENDGSLMLVNSNSSMVQIDKSSSLLQKIKLGAGAMQGVYVLNSSLIVNNNEYIQSQLFSIEGKLLTTITGEVIDNSNINSILAWNVIVSLIIIIMILTLVIFEYRRFFIYDPIDEETLGIKKYFNDKK